MFFSSFFIYKINSKFGSLGVVALHGIYIKLKRTQGNEQRSKEHKDRLLKTKSLVKIYTSIICSIPIIYNSLVIRTKSCIPAG